MQNVKAQIEDSAAATLPPRRNLSVLDIYLHIGKVTHHERCHCNLRALECKYIHLRIAMLPVSSFHNFSLHTSQAAALFVYSLASWRAGERANRLVEPEVK